MKKALVFTFCFFLFHLVNGQVCKEIANYYESIDTTNRPVYLVVEKMPEILESTNLMKLFQDSEILKGLECRPIKVWFAFIIETDSSLTNIEVCANMLECNDSLLQSETAILNERVKSLLKNTKSNSGILNGEKVAVACTSYIRYEL